MEEDIFRVAYFLHGLTICVFLLGGLCLVSEAHLHEGHLAEGRIGGAERPCNHELLNDCLHLLLRFLVVRRHFLLLLLGIIGSLLGLLRFLILFILILVIGTSLAVILIVLLLSINLWHFVDLENSVERVTVPRQGESLSLGLGVVLEVDHRIDAVVVDLDWLSWLLLRCLSCCFLLQLLVLLLLGPSDQD